jgi:hypothetical protein
MMVARDPSAKTQSRDFTELRIAPNFNECGPAALVETIPPIVQNAALDGSAGRRRPSFRAASSIVLQMTPGSARMLIVSRLTFPIALRRERSTITPGPTAPPAIPLPDPRGIKDCPDSRAHFTSAATSFALAGTATAAGTMREMPAPSE